MPLDLVCLGEPMVEFNQDRKTGGFLMGHGGDTSNCAIAAARQGARAGYLTALGVDDFGDSFLALWDAEGVDRSRVVRKPGARTAIYFVTHGAAGHRFSYYRDGSAASLMRSQDVPTDYVADTRILHVSGISQAISASACDAVFHAIALAQANGVTVSYDPNLRLNLWPLARARAVIHGAMALCDIALPGYDDALQLTGRSDPDAMVDFYLGLGASVVALTLGAEGTLVATPGERRRITGRRVQPVDATAAGDTYDGAFLAEIARGSHPFAAADYANAAAALSTLGYGAVAPIPTRRQVEAFLDDPREGPARAGPS